ncbi:MAG: ABC transporter ATP-binding protein [Vulcanimicrobiota bacterium]
MSLVELASLRVAFPHPSLGQVEILRGIDLSIAEGELLTVVGESGCGKSTLGRVILGLQKPTGGSVSYEGRQLHTPDFEWTTERRLMVSVVHQDSYAALNPLRTVGAILRAPLRRHRPDCDQEKTIRDLLSEVGLTPPERYLDAYSFQLSGGQRQRVALARAVLLEPRLVVADEPISGVDAAVKLEILDLIRRFNGERGTAFVYITHDLATASLMERSRLLVLYLGQVVELGSMPKLLKQPGHPYLQALLSAVVPPDPEQARQRPPLDPALAENPDPARPPSGCLFHPRCPGCFEPCPGQRPTLLSVGDDHQVACHLFSEI